MLAPFSATQKLYPSHFTGTGIPQTPHFNIFEDTRAALTKQSTTQSQPFYDTLLPDTLSR
jgi:hypothetical protein